MLSIWLQDRLTLDVYGTPEAVDIFSVNTYERKIYVKDPDMLAATNTRRFDVSTSFFGVEKYPFRLECSKCWWGELSHILKRTNHNFSSNKYFRLS